MNIPNETVQSIKDKIDDAHHILLQCHKNPDPDSTGSALSWKRVLESMGKRVTVVSPTKLSAGILGLYEESSNIEVVDFQTFDFSPYDLFILNDTASTSQITGYKVDFEFPNMPTIVIDHHKSNNLSQETEVIIDTAFSTTQILIHLFEQLEFEIDSRIATFFYTGMLTDTYNFLFAELDSEFFNDLAKVIDYGADAKFVINTLQKNNSLEELHAIGEIMNAIEINTDKSFAWVYVDPKLMDKYEISYHDLKDKIADEIINTIENTEFGIVLYKSNPTDNLFGLSLRARSDEFDCSVLAKKLNGGGHQNRAGASVEADSLEEAVSKISEVV